MIRWMMVFMVFPFAWLDLQMLFMVGQWLPISLCCHYSANRKKRCNCRRLHLNQPRGRLPEMANEDRAPLPAQRLDLRQLTWLTAGALPISIQAVEGPMSCALKLPISTNAAKAANRP